ncbi:hypothetical protein MNV49_002341 [Pseudohyphozyma bogoriensis]|nr:hypothetical protein MNV49_002341 [Pseudohyphozyma bogoriensis]
MNAVDDILPPLLATLRNSSLPTPLRSSALTILATAVETAPVAMLSYGDDLAETCITILQVESRIMKPRVRVVEEVSRKGKEKAEEDSESDDEGEGVQLDRHGRPKKPEETPNPTTTDAKHPSLRRGALLFLALVFRTAARLAEDSASSSSSMRSDLGLGGFRMPGAAVVSGAGGGGTARMLVSLETKKRARTVVRYVGETDEDALVRHQAGEVLEELEGDIPYQVNPIAYGRGPQSGYNVCNSTTEGPDALCQTAFLNSLDDFCLWGSATPDGQIGDVEAAVVAYCTKSGHGTRIMPGGTITALQYMRTSAYVQVVGLFDQTGIELMSNDTGGELDPHGADQLGNPLGGLVWSTNLPEATSNTTLVQVQNWNMFVGSGKFCFKICSNKVTWPDYCENRFDLIGLPATMPWTPRVPASSKCTTYASTDIFKATNLGYQQDLYLFIRD